MDMLDEATRTPASLFRRLKTLVLRRRGMVGTIVVTLVLGYMLTVSFSNTYLIQSEIKGAAAKGNNRKAYFAAFAGVNFVVSRLRQDSTNTYAGDYGEALYFSDVADATRNHYCAFKLGGAGDVTYTSFLSPHSGAVPKPKTDYKCTSTFANNTEVDPENYFFYVSGYPGSTTAGIYWVKSQGVYQDNIGDTTTESRCQIWAELDVDRSGEMVLLKRFGTMPLQSLTYNSAAGTNDFWDWESF